MKNTFFLTAAAFLFATSVNAQSTVDSIAAKYKLLPMPEPLTIERAFPVVGSYQLTTSAGAQAQPVSISIDSVNKGMIWISGLPEGKMKAYLVKSPGTYRIISQKSVSGKIIPEGTLVLDPATNNLNVAIGSYNAADPASVFPVSTTSSTTVTDPAPAVKEKTKTSVAKSKSKQGAQKSKIKTIYYSATKLNATSTAGTGSNSSAQQQ